MPFALLVILLVAGFALATDPTFTKLTDPASLPSLSLNLGWTANETAFAIADCSATVVDVYKLTGSGASTTLTKATNPGGLPSTGCGSLAWNPNGTLLAQSTSLTTAQGLIVYRWDGTSLTLCGNLPSLPTGAGATVQWQAWSADGHYLVATEGVAPRFLVWYTAGDCTFTKLADPTLPGSSVCYRADWQPTLTNPILSVGCAVTPFIWNYQLSGTGASATLTKLSDPTTLPATEVYMVKWSPSGANIAVNVAGTGNHMMGYNVSGTTFTAWAVPAGVSCAGNNCVVQDLNWTPDSSVVTWSAGGTTTSGTPWVFNLKPGSGNMMANPDTIPSGKVEAVSWDMTGTYLSVVSQVAPKFITYKYNNAGAGSFTKLSDPSTLPGTPQNGLGYQGPPMRWSPLNSYVAISLAASPNVFVYSTAIGVIPAPTAPVLSATVTGLPLRCVLVWTTPSSVGTIQGYNVTETSEYGTTSVTTYGLVNTASFIPHTRTWSYTVHAWTGGAVNGTESNSATCVQAPMNLTGENGVIYGGGRTALASGWGVPATALDLTLAILIIVIMGGTGWALIRPAPAVGAGVFACIGFFLDIALRLIPIWVVFFFIVVIGAVFMIARSRSQGGG